VLTVLKYGGILMKIVKDKIFKKTDDIVYFIMSSHLELNEWIPVHHDITTRISRTIWNAMGHYDVGVEWK